MKNLFDLIASTTGGLHIARCLALDGQHPPCVVCSKPLPVDGDGDAYGMGLVAREMASSEVVAIACPNCHGQFARVQS